MWGIFLPEILILACASSSPVFLMMYSAYKLNKQGDNIQPWRIPFPIWNQQNGVFVTNRLWRGCWWWAKYCALWDPGVFESVVFLHDRSSQKPYTQESQCPFWKSWSCKCSWESPKANREMERPPIPSSALNLGCSLNHDCCHQRLGVRPFLTSRAAPHLSGGIEKPI